MNKWDYDGDFMEEPCPCPRCGSVVEHSSMRPARTAESKVLQKAFDGKLLCRDCCAVKKTGRVYLAGGYQ